MITRGTTPNQVFNTSIDLSEAVVLFISYSQFGKVVIEKDIDDCTVTSDSVSTYLSQYDTLLLDHHKAVQIQIRAKFGDGEAVASNIIETDVGAILKGGVI